MKNRKEKQKEYFEKYHDIPIDYNDRLNWMIDNYNLSSMKMNMIINKKRNMENSLFYTRLKIVLLEDPEGAKRPRFRFITKSNFNRVAMESPGFVHVYSPNAAEDNNYMHRLIDQELIQLDSLIYTQCNITINAYIKTPSYFNTVDTFLAEIGYHRNISKPDWDNIGKKYSDMFNKNIWLDDSLVVDGRISKFYSILPRLEIYIDYLNCFTHKHQFDSVSNKNDIDNIFYIGKEGNIYDKNRCNGFS